MGFDNGTKGGRERKGSRPSKPGRTGGNPSRVGTKSRKGDAPELGQALRSVYDSTLNEDIPPEMLDLLGKLG